jgi:hypothetical protein
MRIRIQLITLIRILPFNFMRIQIHNTAYNNRYGTSTLYMRIAHFSSQICYTTFSV